MQIYNNKIIAGDFNKKLMDINRHPMVDFDILVIFAKVQTNGNRRNS